MFQPKQVVKVKSLDAIERGIILHVLDPRDTVIKQRQLAHIKGKVQLFNQLVTLIYETGSPPFWKVAYGPGNGYQTWVHYTWIEPIVSIRDTIPFEREYHCQVNPHMNKGCQHTNKSMRVFQTFNYMYCPDCKKEVT